MTAAKPAFSWRQRDWLGPRRRSQRRLRSGLYLAVAAVLAASLSACSALGLGEPAASPDGAGSGASTQRGAVPTAADPAHSRPPRQPGYGLGLPTQPPLASPEPGHGNRIYMGSGRWFIVHVPHNYSVTEQWPVIVALHGWGEGAAAIYESSDFRYAHAISVYPQGSPEDSPAWAPAPYAATSAAEDEEFIRAIIDMVRATYSIDDSRIYLAGFSNGGGLAAYLGCQLPDVVNSIATVAAAYYDSVYEDCATEPVGRLIVHGTDDEVISYEGGTRHQTRYTGVREVIAGDAVRNGCSDTTRHTQLSHGAELEEYLGCQRPLAHVRLNGGGHVWPGGTADPNRADMPGFATDKILDFFAIPGRAPGNEDEQEAG